MQPAAMVQAMVFHCVLALALASRAPRLAVPFVPGTYAETPGMVNSGTPALVPPTADCAVRKLALEHGQALMPAKRGFRTLYDALQLAACGVPPPAESDAWTPPRAHGGEPARRVQRTLTSFCTVSHASSSPALHHSSRTCGVLFLVAMRVEC